jgi:hypothetical protein
MPNEHDIHQFNTRGETSAGPPSSPAGQPAILLDPEKYRSVIVDAGLSVEEEQEYLETVWAVLLQAMLLGIRLETAPQNCGKPQGPAGKRPAADGNMLNSTDSDCQSMFRKAALDVRTAEEGR